MLVALTNAQLGVHIALIVIAVMIATVTITLLCVWAYRRHQLACQKHDNLLLELRANIVATNLSLEVLSRRVDAYDKHVRKDRKR